MTMEDIREINWTATPLEEALEVFENNYQALTIAIAKSHKDQPNKIIKNLKRNNYAKYEQTINQILENNTKRDIKRLIALSNIDFSECLVTLKSVNEFIRLSDFRETKEFSIGKEIKNLEEITKLCASTIYMLNKIKKNENIPAQGNLF